MSVSFSFADFLIVAIILISAGYAAWRGFLSETLSVFEWVAAAFACLYLGPYFIPLTHSLVAAWWLANLLAYAGVFLAVFIPLAFMSHRFAQSVKNSPIGPLDRALGVAFGIVRGMVVIGLAYLAFTYFVPIRQHPRWLAEARLLPAVQATSEALLSLVPGPNRHVASVRPAYAPEVVRQAPAPAAVHDSRPDPLGEIIRRNAATEAPKAAAMQPQVARKDAKRYGAQDRQALDKLIEATGNGK
jgi:membrane protein required for colicin V production